MDVGITSEFCESRDQNVDGQKPLRGSNLESDLHDEWNNVLDVLGKSHAKRKWCCPNVVVDENGPRGVTCRGLSMSRG